MNPNESQKYPLLPYSCFNDSKIEETKINNDNDIKLPIPVEYNSKGSCEELHLAAASSHYSLGKSPRLKYL